MHPQIKGRASLPSDLQFGSIKHHLDLFMPILLDTNINWGNYELSIIQWFNSPYIHLPVYIMDATHYWPFAREYPVWNAAVTALQFWMADLEPHILSNAIERVYTAFFFSDSAQQLWNLSEEVLFGWFVTTLKDTFKRELAQEYEGYESGSESLSIPTPVRKVPQIYHVSTNENLSSDPTTPLITDEQSKYSSWRFRSHNPVCCCLVFTSSDDETSERTTDPCLWHCSTLDNNPLQGRAESSSPFQHHMDYHHTSTPNTDDSFQDATADFPTAWLDDNIWLEDPVPDRHLYIHEQSQPHYQCSYPCPYSLDLPHSAPEYTTVPYYEMTDLSDISDLQDVMTTTSDEDIPDLEDMFGL